MGAGGVIGEQPKKGVALTIAYCVKKECLIDE